MFSSGGPVAPGLALGTALPTLLLGALWAALLRWKRTLGSTSVRVGWLLSVPLAALNAGVACGVMFATEGNDPFTKLLLGAMIGATFGAFIWIPALIATLVCFGIPIAWSQRLASRGLSGAERGEFVIGAASAVLAAGGLALVPFDRGMSLGIGSLAGIGVLAVLCALLTCLVAASRAFARRAFVKAAAEGQVPGIRVEETPEGRALVRVTSHGQGYRVTDFHEELVRLREDDDVIEAAAQSRRS
jgi:hypothetical protein